MSSLSTALESYKIATLFSDANKETGQKEVFSPYNIIKAALEELNLLTTPVTILYYLNYSSTKKFSRLFAKEDPRLNKLNQLFFEIRLQVALTETIIDEHEKNKIKLELIVVLAQSGDIYEALEYAKRLAKPLKELALLQITLALIEFKNLERAKEVALSIIDSKPRRTALMCVSYALTNENRIDEALQIAAKIPKTSGKRNRCLQSIVEKLSDKKRFKKAINIMQSMDNAINALEKIIVEMLKDGKQDQVLQLIRGEKEIDSKNYDLLLERVSNRLLREGFPKEALEIIKGMVHIQGVLIKKI